MQKIMLFLITFIFFNNAKSQLTKGNWMLGGNANFSYASANADNNSSKTSTINLTPDIGYFIIDKLSGGIRSGFYKNIIKYGQPNYNSSKFSYYTVGPFVRYYLLSVEKLYNILTEVSYEFGAEKVEINGSGNQSTPSNKFSFTVGPVIYFNSSVGIEFLLNYTSLGNNGSKSRANSFGAGIGLQIHLQKDNL